MPKRDWRLDRKLWELTKKVTKDQPKEHGKGYWQNLPADKAKRIDPRSAKGREIAAKYTSTK